MSSHPQIQGVQPPSVHLASPENVLLFWFGTPGTNEGDMSRIRRWFRSGAPMDEEIARHLGLTIEAALRHELDSWATTARGRLALVLLLDQMTRSFYRNDPRSYAGDAHAQALSTEAFDRVCVANWTSPSACFSPCRWHTPKMSRCRSAARLATESAVGAPPAYRTISAMTVEQTVRYLGIIRRFGRFPHRNEVLGRTSTPEEIEFLRTWAEVQMPKSVRPAI